MQPTAYRSVQGPIWSPSPCACSGAMYSGVPTVAPAAVRSSGAASSLVTFAIPKSAILTPPS